MNPITSVSIKKRLFIWLGFSFLLITICAVIGIYSLINNQINNYFDNTLRHESNNIIDRLYVSNKQIKFKHQHLGINLQTSAGDSSVFYSIKDTGGKLLAGFQSIPEPHQNVNQQGFYDVTFFDQPIRVFRTIHTLVRSKHSYTVIITIAETLEDRNKIIYKIFSILSLITISIAITTLFFTLFSINKGLAPLEILQHSIKRRDIHDLTPIKEEKTPIEVISLVLSINQLFTRLKKSFTHIEHFNEDVSHQLRTPLAELKLMIQTDEIIDNQQKTLYLECIETMVHTTEQLLLHAHTNPDAYDRVRFKPFNITALCKKVASHKAPILYNNGFDIIFEAKNDLWIIGSDVVIESLLNNLIDNAQKYAKNDTATQENKITLSLQEDEETFTMSIIDNGPGIPEKYLEKIFDRFFRLDTKKKGTGLGLNIVKQIVELHNGSINLSNISPHGLNVSITFPKYISNKKSS